MMGIIYGVVWGGLYKTVGIATEAERRKNEGDKVMNKTPKKKAKPPAKPPTKGNIAAEEQAQQQPSDNEQEVDDDNVVDVDYEEVEEEK